MSAFWILDDGRIMGGGQRFALRLAQAVVSGGDSAALLTPGGSDLAAAAANAGVPVHVVAAPDPRPAAAWRWPGAAWALRRALRAAPDDTTLVAGSVRCQALAILVLATMRAASRPALVHLMHEQESADRQVVRLALRRSGAIAAVGANATARYERALGRPVTEVPNFLDDAQMVELEALRARRRPLDRTRPPAIGVLARLIPEKGMLELVGELAEVPRSWGTASLGAPLQDGAYAAAVREAIERAGLADRVRLVGEVEDVAAFLAGIDVLVVPSTGHEGQPTVIIEALAAGLAVIVREPIWSADYSGLPVTAYRHPAGLALALQVGKDVPIPSDELKRRFSAHAARGAIATAAASSRLQRERSH